jgi:hypothetical protein
MGNNELFTNPVLALASSCVETFHGSRFSLSRPFSLIHAGYEWTIAALVANTSQRTLNFTRGLA